MAFEEAAKDWHVLLKEVDESFINRHLGSSMQLAVALRCQDEQDAEELAKNTPEDGERPFLALTEVLRSLLDVAIRDHMAFLLPSAETNAPKIGSSQKLELARQQAQIQCLPDAFQLRFRQLLERNWSKLTQTSETTFALPRMQQLDFKVKVDGAGAKQILVRLQTSDGKTRTIQMPLKQFHQLRYCAATVLQEMNEVEAHPMMRLAYMEQSNRTDVATSSERQVQATSAASVP